MKLEQAIDILKQQFKTAYKQKYVTKPISWALYHTWRIVEQIEEERIICDLVKEK